MAPSQSSLDDLTLRDVARVQITHKPEGNRWVPFEDDLFLIEETAEWVEMRRGNRKVEKIEVLVAGGWRQIGSSPEAKVIEWNAVELPIKRQTITSVESIRLTDLKLVRADTCGAGMHEKWFYAVCDPTLLVGPLVAMLAEDPPNTQQLDEWRLDKRGKSGLLLTREVGGLWLSSARRTFFDRMEQNEAVLLATGVPIGSHSTYGTHFHGCLKFTTKAAARLRRPGWKPEFEEQVCSCPARTR